MLSLSSPLKLRTTITLLVCFVIAIVLFAVHSVYLTQSTALSKSSLEEKAIAVAHTLTETPFVAKALQDRQQQAALQQYIESVRKKNDLLFIVVMDMQGIRHTHPDPTKVGQHFIGGDEVNALHGQEFISEAKGTLGDSLRIFTPLYDQGIQVGAIAVGISTAKVLEVIQTNRWVVYWALVFGALIGAVGAFYLARKIKSIMFGLEPSEIASLLEERSAILQSIREGVIAVDQDANITLINEAAKRLLRQHGSVEQLLMTESSKHWPKLLHLQEVLETGTSQQDEELMFNGMTLLTSSMPVRVNNQIVGAVVTFRDKTEVSQLIERLSGMSHYAEALRLQTHEFMNKLHVILGMVNIKAYDQLEHYILGVADHYQSEVGSLVKQIKDPVIAGFLLGKINRAKKAGIELTITEESYLPPSTQPAIVHELVTVMGNLLENAIEELAGCSEPAISIALDYEDSNLLCVIKDNGKGIDPDVLPYIFEQGFSTKGEGRGLGLHLVKQSLAKLGHSTIECKNNLGQGVCFMVTMPYLCEESTHD